MNSLFLIYTALAIVSISICYALIYFTFFNKKINNRDWLWILVGVLVLTIGINVVDSGKRINDKLSVEFKVPRDVYSGNEYPNDSTINDNILYNYLLDMRVPHAKIVLCQAKIESASYTSVLYQRQYNLFGMKIPSTRPTSGNGGKAGYQNYNNFRESVMDYTLWQFSHNVDKLSHEDYLVYLGKIYAEDPKYVDKIRKMLTEINFNKLEN